MSSQKISAEQVLEALVAIISAIACAVFAGYLIQKRRNKVHYKLCIGLCVAFVVTNACSVTIALGISISKIYFFPIHVASSSVIVLYISAMFMNFLLKCNGVSEDTLRKQLIWLHPFMWGVGAFYYSCCVWYLYLYYHHEGDSSEISHETQIPIILIYVCLAIISVVCPVFMILSTIYIIVKHWREYFNKGEVYSPLLSSMQKSKIASFHVRLWCFVSLAIMTSSSAVFLGTYFWVEGKAWDALGVLCSICGLLVCLLLASAPELKRFYERKLENEVPHSGSIS